MTKQRFIGLALCLLGGGVFGLWWQQEAELANALQLTVAAVLFGTGLATLFTGSIRSLFSLNLFLPFVNRKWQPKGGPGFATRIAHSILPRSLFFDPATGRQGHLRRFLRWLGPSVVSSPFRRVVQGFCFVIFLALFFYVCWPYTAAPEPDGKISVGWQFDRIDDTTGDSNSKEATSMRAFAAE